MDLINSRFIVKSKKIYIFVQKMISEPFSINY